VWFSETEQKRNSLIDLYEALQSHPGSSRRKRSLDDNADNEATRAKRQRALHDGEAEFKYVTLADAVASLSTDQTSSQSEPESETQAVTFDYAMSYMNKVKVRILPTQKRKSVFIFSRLDAC
jgi:histone deacetylase complex regulatory component SIN3